MATDASQGGVQLGSLSSDAAWFLPDVTVRESARVVHALLRSLRRCCRPTEQGLFRKGIGSLNAERLETPRAGASKPSVRQRVGILWHDERQRAHLPAARHDYPAKSSKQVERQRATSCASDLVIEVAGLECEVTRSSFHETFA